MSSKLKILFFFVPILILINLNSVYAFENLEIVDSALQQLGYYEEFKNKTTSNNFSESTVYGHKGYKNISSYSKLQEIINDYDWILFLAKENGKVDIGGYTLACASIFCGYGEVNLNEAMTKITFENYYQKFYFIYKYGNKGLIEANYSEYDTVNFANNSSEYDMLILIDKGEVIKTKNYEAPVKFGIFLNDNILDGKLTLENNKQVDFVPYNKLGENSFKIATIYSETFEDIGLVQIERKNEDWSTSWNNYFIDLYRKGEIVGGKITGYLKPIFNTDGNYIYSDVYVPSYFIENRKFYNISLYDRNLEFINQTDYFYISERDENGNIIYSGTIGSGDSTNSIENSIEQASNNIISGILNGIIGLFIPSGDFFQNYFNDLNDWFSARLGLLYYPIDLLFDFFNRCLSIDFNNQVLSIGPYTMPLNDDFELVPKLEFNFKTFVENDYIKSVYDSYLIIVDGLIIFGLVKLIQIKYEELMTK